MAAERKPGRWRGACRKDGGRQTGWRTVDRMAAGRQTGEQAEMLVAGRQFGDRQTVWRFGGRQTVWRQADWLAACRLAGRYIGWRQANGAQEHMLAACRQGGGRQIVLLVTLMNLLTSILKTISAQTESSEFHIIELEQYLFRDRIFFCVQVCARVRKVAL
jgi:hypothetical protein